MGVYVYFPNLNAADVSLSACSPCCYSQIAGGGVYALSTLKIPSKGLLSLLGYVDDAVFVACVAFYLNVLYKAVAPLGAARSAPAQGVNQEEPVTTLDDSHLH